MSEPPHAVQVAAIVASVTMFVATLVGIPLFFARIPDDYFCRPVARGPYAARVVRNVAGCLLVLCGIAMLVLPGQGILTAVVGLMLIDFPGKRRLVRRLLEKPNMAHAIDTLRRRAGRGRLIPPPERVPSRSRRHS